jgi:hypothetical protein
MSLITALPTGYVSPFSFFRMTEMPVALRNQNLLTFSRLILSEQGEPVVGPPVPKWKAYDEQQSGFLQGCLQQLVSAIRAGSHEPVVGQHLLNFCGEVHLTRLELYTLERLASAEDQKDTERTRAGMRLLLCRAFATLYASYLTPEKLIAFDFGEPERAVFLMRESADGSVDYNNNDDYQSLAMSTLSFLLSVDGGATASAIEHSFDQLIWTDAGQ